MLALIDSRRLPHVHLLLEVALLVAAHVALVARCRFDQFALGHELFSCGQESLSRAVVPSAISLQAVAISNRAGPIWRLLRLMEVLVELTPKQHAGIAIRPA
jgi:hypothetical protein